MFAFIAYFTQHLSYSRAVKKTYGGMSGYFPSGENQFNQNSPDDEGYKVQTYSDIYS
jgi:hypothetical protein